jgi:hypothetical protein
MEEKASYIKQQTTDTHHTHTIKASAILKLSPSSIPVVYCYCKPLDRQSSVVSGHNHMCVDLWMLIWLRHERNLLSVQTLDPNASIAEPANIVTSYQTKIRLTLNHFLQNSECLSRVQGYHFPHTLKITSQTHHAEHD